MSQAATELVDTVGRGAGDPGLRVLLALTARPQTPIARLVDYCGADAAVLCADAARAEAELSESSELTAHRYRLTDEYASYGLDRVAESGALRLGAGGGSGRTAVRPRRADPVGGTARGARGAACGRRRAASRWAPSEGPRALAPGGDFSRQDRMVVHSRLGPSRRRGPPRAGPATGGGARRRPPPPDPGSSDLGRFGPIVYWFSWRWIRLGVAQMLTGIARAAAELL